MESMESHKAGFPPLQTLWKSLRYYHIPTASTARFGIEKQRQRPTLNPNLSLYPRKGVVTDVPGPKCNGCSGTLIPQEVWLPMCKEASLVCLANVRSDGAHLEPLYFRIAFHSPAIGGQLDRRISP